MAVFSLRALLKFIEYFQVERHGRYSNERICNLAEFQQTTSVPHAIGVLVTTALPCLVWPIVLASVELANPEDGLSGNWLFYIRLFFVWWQLGYLAAKQWGLFVLSIPLGTVKRLIIGGVTATSTTGITLGISKIVGFPLPFTLAIGAPFLVSGVAIGVALHYRGSIEAVSAAWPQIVSHMKVWMCQLSLVAIYPSYFYIFTSLPASAQLPFACLLPGVKVLVRNWLSRALVHLSDEMSEHVLFNADVFSSLFIAYCMQTVPSAWTTAGLMAIDGAQILIAAKEISHVLFLIEMLQANLDTSDSVIRSCEISASSQGVKKAIELSENQNVLQVAHRVISQRMAVPSFALVPMKSSLVPGPVTSSSGRCEWAFLKGRFNVFPGASVSPFMRNKDLIVAVPPRNSFPTVGSCVVALPSPEQQLLELISRLLFFTEFLLLLNFVEVVIPIVYTLSLFAHYYLANRSYYPALAELSEKDFHQMISTVALYALMELLSLVILCWALTTKLRFFTPAQLAFVLQRQFDGVQLKLVFWVLFSSETTLQHYGYDYTFKFAWLNRQQNS